MDSLPYDFCKSVVLTLIKPSPLAECHLGPGWKAALCVPNNVTRVMVCLTVYFCEHSQSWMYKLLHGDSHNVRRLTFKELQAIDSEHLRISYVKTRGAGGIAASIEEIRELMCYTAPFVNLTSLSLSEDCIFGASIQVSGAYRLPSKSQILKVMAEAYRNCWFGDIIIQYDRLPAEFFRKHFNSEFKPEYLESIPQRVAPISLGDIVLAMPSKEIDLQNTYFSFDMDFYEQLIEKPLVDDFLRFRGRFQFAYAEAETLNQHLVRNEYPNAICWPRTDGVWVSVRALSPEGDLEVEMRKERYATIPLWQEVWHQRVMPHRNVWSFLAAVLVEQPELD